ncbi:MAG: flagellar motor switch protein FliN [bacterium]
MSHTEQQEEEKNKKTDKTSETSSVNENEDADDNISWDDAFKEEAKAGGDNNRNGKDDNKDKETGGFDADTAVNNEGGAEQNKEKEAESIDDISWDDAFEEAKADSPLDRRDSAEPVSQNDENKNENNVSTDNENKNGKQASSKNKFNVKKVEFASFDVNDKTSEPPKNLEFILDIPLSISVELGRTKMVINDMLQLGQGSVIELDKLAGEPLEVYVNNKLMAKGEVVLVNDKFGVRLTDIISPIERVQKL